jgi:uncharacterized protein YcbK (DUF882 family)
MHGKLFCEDKKIDDLDQELRGLMNGIEGTLKIDFEITSGVRCEQCNKNAGGVPKSAHTQGKALDIAVPNSNVRFLLVKQLILRNINRIGIGKTFVHIDNDKSLPKNVIWDYYNEGK